MRVVKLAAIVGCIVWSSTASGHENTNRPTRITVRLVQEEQKTKPLVAVFRLTNTSKQSLRMAMTGNSPSLVIQSLTEGKWEIVHWSWCLNGKRIETLEPAQSMEWSVDVAKYRAEYGLTLRFSEGFDRQNGKFLWSEAFDFSVSGDDRR